MVWIVSQSFYSWIIVLIYSKCCTLTGRFISSLGRLLRGGGWLGWCSCPTPSPKKPGQARFIPAHRQVLGHLSTLKVYEVQAFYSSPYLFNVK